MSEVATPGVRFDANGLIPAVIQDAATGEVLMLAYMNQEALRLTRETRRAHYWSRSRSRIWRKGETSGNEQIVDEIRINCELNSLLLRVRQAGAVCHDGYDTCYYRRLEDDGGLTSVRERAFDPAMVYGSATKAGADESRLAKATRLQFGAYCYLRDNDLTGVSGTSRRLRAEHDDPRPRIADELEELAGVLDGSHMHTDPRNDALLEASQVIYWVLLGIIRAGHTWDEVRPDVALAVADDPIGAATISTVLRAKAHRWRSGSPPPEQLAAETHATLTLVGQACQRAGVEPLAAIESDLDELRTRNYLAPYFSERAGQSGIREP